MKNLHGLKLFVAFALLGMAACQNDTLLPEVPQSGQADKSGNVYITADDFRCEDEMSTRSSLTVENGYVYFNWTVGDLVGILPNQGAQVYFEIPEPEEGEEVGKTAKFDGGAWALKPTSNYAAYYPFVEDFHLDRTKVPVSYTGQKQVGNNSTAHLGDYDYMGARPVQTNQNGGVTFDFDHVGALLLVKFTVPHAGTQLKSVSLSAEGSTFVAEGTYNLTSEEGFPITATSTADAMTVDVEYTTVTDDETVSVYLMTAPINLLDKTVNISVAVGDGSESLKYTCPGKNLQAANSYMFMVNIPYLTFIADATQTLTVQTKETYTLDESLQYSVNGSEWRQLKADEPITFGGSNGALRMRGKSAAGMASDYANYATFALSISGVPVKCQGDIRTLVDYENYSTADTKDARFTSLFQGCTALSSAPELPATTLADHCYDGMFFGCTGLTSAPELPATTLTYRCYAAMFSGCCGLTSVPKLLPATTLAANCYGSMFFGCTGLTSAPELPATTLAERCYGNMFFGCTGLTSAPELPATTLAESCYTNMFRDCSRLTSAPELPATTLADYCYDCMFWQCTGLTSAPELPATTLAEGCYSHMFYCCRGLVSAPEQLPATTLSASCYTNMFAVCTSLTSAPELPATTLSDHCYYSMFSECTGLTSAPELPATTLTDYCYHGMFSHCAKLNKVTMLATDISAYGCLDYWLYNVSSTGTFTKATEMTSLPTGASGIPSGWTVQNYGN